MFFLKKKKKKPFHTICQSDSYFFFFTPLSFKFKFKFKKKNNYSLQSLKLKRVSFFSHWLNNFWMTCYIILCTNLHDINKQKKKTLTLYHRWTSNISSTCNALMRESLCFVRLIAFFLSFLYCYFQKKRLTGYVPCIKKYFKK